MTQKSAWMVLVMLWTAACSLEPAAPLGEDPMAASDLAPQEETEFFQEEDFDGEAALDAPDPELGEEFAQEDPFEEPDACLDFDLCEEAAGMVDLAALEDEEGAPAPEDAAAKEAPVGEAEPLRVGARLLTLTYAGMHRHASASSALLAVPPHGGVDANALHPNRNPRGLVPPAQVVALLDADAQNGFYRVRYHGVTGWLARRKLVALDTSVSPVRFAMRSNVRNAFFKHQILRSRWNKDGPLSSGNCAPTSLAMAARVFGAEPSGMSVEESIHRARATYDRGLHESRGTTRAQIETAARALHLNVKPLKTDLPPSQALARVNTQLNAGRVVVLAGMPGKAGSGPTAYEQAFTRAYSAAIRRGARLRHRSYDFNGGHSILVLGRDANGRYVVGDPISEVGYLAITGGELKDFMTRFTGARGVGNAVWK
jgi:hypothetical protein